MGTRSDDANIMLSWIVAASMMPVMIMMVRTRSGDVKPKFPLPPHLWQLWVL